MENLRGITMGVPESGEIIVLIQPVKTNKRSQLKNLSCNVFPSSSLVRGPGVFGEVQVYWNITPAAVSEFEAIFGTVTMRDGQSTATITIKVLSSVHWKIVALSLSVYLRTKSSIIT